MQLKVLGLCDVLFPQTTGGAGRVARELSAALCRQGVQMELLTRKPAKPTPAVGNIPTTYYPAPGIKLMYELRRIFLERVHKFKPDIVHVHQPLPAYVAIPSGFPKPVVYSFYSPWPEELKIKASRWPRWTRSPAVAIFRHIERSAVESATSIVVLSETSRNEVSHFYGRETQVIPGGVNTQEFRPVNVPRQPGTAKLITVRNLVPRMGLNELIQAMQLVPQHVYLEIGGDGPLRMELQQLVNSLKLDQRVRLMGRIPDHELPRFYSSADWFVLPTAALEGFGLVILESLSCGTPVLGTRVGAIPELLQKFDPDWIIDKAAPEAIAEAINRAIGRPRPDSRQLHNRVAGEYDWNAIALRYKKLFEQLTARTVTATRSQPVFP